jgi:hypothetical protein
MDIVALARHHHNHGRAARSLTLRFLTLYDVRPQACASIFHASPRFENV